MTGKTASVATLRCTLLLAALGASPLQAAGPPYLPPVPVFDLWERWAPRKTLEETAFHPQLIVALSPDGEYVAYFNDRSQGAFALEVWSVSRRKLVFRNSLGDARGRRQTGCLYFAPDGKSLFAGMLNQKQVPRKPWAPPWLISGKPKPVPDMITISRLAIPSGKVLASLELPPKIGWGAVLLPDGKTLAMSSPEEAALLYDFASGKRIARLKGDEKMPPPWFDPKTGKARPYVPAEHENKTTHLAASPDGKLLAVGTVGGWISVWDIAKRERLWRERVKGSWRVLQFSLASDVLMTLGDSGRLTFWTARKGVEKWAFTGRCSLFAGYLPDGNVILDRYNRPGFVRWDPVEDVVKGDIWNDFNLAKKRDWRGYLAGPHGCEVRCISSPKCMAISADGKKVALICSMRFTNRLTVYDLTKIKWPVRTDREAR